MVLSTCTRETRFHIDQHIQKCFGRFGFVEHGGLVWVMGNSPHFGHTTRVVDS